MRQRVQFNLGLSPETHDKIAAMARKRGVSKTAVALEMVNHGLSATPEGLTDELRQLREQSTKSMMELERRLITNERMLHLLIAELRPDVVAKALESVEPGKRTRAHAVVDDVAEAQATMQEMADKLNG